VSLARCIYDAANPAQRARAHADINRHTTGRLVMTIDEESTKRTVRQNNMLWAIYENDVVPALSRAGFCDTDKDGAHYLMRMLFHFKTITNLQTGEEIKVPKSTANMSTKAFSKYVDNIVRHLAQMGWVVRLPDDYHELCGGAGAHGARSARAAAQLAEVAHA